MFVTRRQEVGKCTKYRVRGIGGEKRFTESCSYPCCYRGRGLKWQMEPVSNQGRASSQESRGEDEEPMYRLRGDGDLKFKRRWEAQNI